MWNNILKNLLISDLSRFFLSDLAHGIHHILLLLLIEKYILTQYIKLICICSKFLFYLKNGNGSIIIFLNVVLGKVNNYNINPYMFFFK